MTQNKKNLKFQKKMKKINVDMICAKKRITNGYKMKRKDETQ